MEFLIPNCPKLKECEVELVGMRTGKCIYHGMKCRYKHVLGIFLSVLGKKKKEITFLLSTFSMSSMIEILPAVRRVWPGMLVHVHIICRLI